MERAADAGEVIPITRRLSRALDEVIARRVEFLTGYQNAAYAARYADARRAGAQAEAEARARPARLDRGGGAQLFKLMAYKDEYEVARLYTDGDFLSAIGASSKATTSSTSTWRRRCWPSRIPATGELKKQPIGPWMLQRLPRARAAEGPARHRLDPFGYTRRSGAPSAS